MNTRSRMLPAAAPATYAVVRTIKTCLGPRGMHFSKDRTKFHVGCTDDDQIAIYDTETLELAGRIGNIEEPGTFDLHPRRGR